MPLAGNDIVDLKDRANAQRSTDLRFLRKILTDSEIDMVTAADSSAAALWSLWASKEAAYKVLKKIDFNTPFIPRRWSLSREVLQGGPPVNTEDVPENSRGVSSARGALRFGEGHVNIPGRNNVYVRLFLFNSCVHCVASDDPDALCRMIWHITPISPSLADREVEPSLWGRQALVRHLSEHLNLSPADMKIEREKKEGEYLPPRVFLRDEPLPVDISLSHDGSFVAGAFLISSAM